MTNNIVQLDEHRPHDTSYVACLDCGKDWVAVAPAGASHFRCSSCDRISGVIVDPSSAEFINAFMRPAKRKSDIQKRMMVILNAKRMIEEGVFE